MDFYNGCVEVQWQFALEKKANLKQNDSMDTSYNHLDNPPLRSSPFSSSPLLHPYAALPLPVWSPLLTTAAPPIRLPVAMGGQVLVDGAAVGDEAHAQLEVSGQATVGRQSQDQQRGEQQETYNQQGHAAGVIQHVWAVQRCSMGLHLEEENGWIKPWLLIIKEWTGHRSQLRQFFWNPFPETSSPVNANPKIQATLTKHLTCLAKSNNWFKTILSLPKTKLCHHITHKAG